MWNAMKTKALFSAVLITATIQGSLLWGIDNLATAGASGMSPANVGSVLATTAESGSQIQHTTLEPVVVVGKRDVLMAEDNATQNDEVTSDTQLVAQDGEQSGPHI